MIRVADYIVDFLYKNGVTHMFTMTGGGSMYLNDALASHPKMKYICQHHEQCCAISADTYTRSSHNIGAAMVTTGPASTNAITGVISAWFDSIPMFIISGQVKLQDTTYNSGIKGFRQMGVQELNIIPLVETITKYAVVITKATEIRYIMEKALYLAKFGRQGPVWIDVPLDIQNTQIDMNKLKGYKIPIKNLIVSQSDINYVINALKVSKKPLVIAGNGIKRSTAQTEFIKLIEKLNIPVVTSNMAADLLDYNHPLNIGPGGIRGIRSANMAMQNADLLIIIGNRLAIPFVGYEYTKFAPKAKKIIVDIDKTDHQKPTIKFDKLIISDAKKFIVKLTNSTTNQKFNFKIDWAKKCYELKDRYPVCLPQYLDDKNGLNMYQIIDQISKHLTNKDIIIADAGSAYYTVVQAMKFKLGQELIIPGGSANMGYNLPACVGASIGSPNKRIICITGDGSLQTNIHDLQTISHHKLPVKLFIFNNQGYLSLRNTQRNFFQGRIIGESINSGLTFPDLKKIATAYNLKYIRINNNKDLIKYIPIILNDNNPIICDLNCLYQQEIIPALAYKKLPDGTSVSTTIDDMYPFISDEEMNSIRQELA